MTVLRSSLVRWLRRGQRVPLADLRQVSDAETERQIAFSAQVRRDRRRVRLLIGLVVLVVVLIGHLLTPQSQTQPASASASTTPYCGTPAAVFAHFGLPSSALPPIAQLTQLPGPGVGAVTYDPRTGQMCATSGQRLAATIHLPGQASGSGAVVAAPQQPQSICNGNSICQAVLDSLQALFGTIMQLLVNGLNAWITEIINLGFMFITPPGDTYCNLTVQTVWSWADGASLGILGFLLLLAGYQYMYGRVRSFYDVLPRVIITALFAHESLFLLSKFIDLQNVANISMLSALGGLGGSFPTPTGCQPLSPGSWTNWPPTQPPNLLLASMDGLVFLFVLVMALTLSIQMLIRLVLLDVLLMVAPFGILCFANDTTRPWGRLWAEAFTSTLVVQFLQLLTIGLGASIQAFLLLHGIVALFMFIAAYYLAFKLPMMLLGRATRAMSAASYETGAVGRAAIRAVAALA